MDSEIRDRKCQVNKVRWHQNATKAQFSTRLNWAFINLWFWCLLSLDSPTWVAASAPAGILLALSIAAAFSVFYLLSKAQISVAVLSLCVLSGTFSAVTLFASYCCLEFEAFHKSGTMAGVLNGTISAGLIVNSYGVTRIADHHGWQAVSRLNVVLTVLAVFLTVAMIPLWKAFKKKYGLSGA